MEMVRVNVNEGLLEGEAVTNEYGGTFYSFKGIPYAQPPVGDLRFQAPLHNKPWDGVRSAKEFGPVCYQMDPLLPNQTNMSEDCLYLNVYTPDIKPKKPLPVMVWIHGGGYMWGSGNDDLYGPDFIIRHDVLLVTFNYRLLAFGFLCLDTAEVPGNAGMKDQVAALKWIKNNISYFGGDSQNITIFGESAGGGSVGYHLISPLSKGLFKRAIPQSGATTCWWAQAFEPREKAFALARQLGFYSENTKELYEFFKNQPAENFINIDLPITLSEKPYAIHFAITSEKDFGQERFFYSDVTDALRYGIHDGVEVLTGYTKDEGLMALSLTPYSLDKIIAHANKYREYFTPNFIKLNCAISEQLKAGREVQQFYFDKPVISLKDYDQLLKYLNMDMFVYGALLSAKSYAEKAKVYLYKFTCHSERNFLGYCLGLVDLIKDKSAVCHADDLPYLFPMKFHGDKICKNSEAFKLIDRMTKLWTNFAKYGNPTPDDSFGVKWKPYTVEKQDYLEIGNQLIAGTGPDKEEMDFWNRVHAKYLPKYSF